MEKQQHIHCAVLLPLAARNVAWLGVGNRKDGYKEFRWSQNSLLTYFMGNQTLLVSATIIETGLGVCANYASAK